MAAGRSDNVISIKVILHDVHTLYSLIMVSDIREVRVCMFVRTVLIVVYTQVVFGGFMWAAYFSMLTSFAPSYGWFIFLRSMVGCGVAAASQGYTHTHTLPFTKLVCPDGPSMFKAHCDSSSLLVKGLF